MAACRSHGFPYKSSLDDRDQLIPISCVSTAWGYQAQDDFRHHLSTPGKTGCRVEMDRPAGETYEFLFPLQNRLSYGKILLTTDKKAIYLFSAHLPLKEDLSCDPKPQPNMIR